MDKIINARYMGEDGSLGYRTEERYNLRVTALRFPCLNYKGTQIVVERLDGTGTCPYHTILDFLNNWTQINVLVGA